MQDKTTKTLLVSSARTLFLEKGYEHTPVEEICELAGLAKGTFFYHFETKQSLVKYLLDMQFAAMAEQVQKALDTCVNPKERLGAFIALLMSSELLPPEASLYFRQKPEWYCKMYDDAGYKYFYPEIEDILCEGVEKGWFAVRNVETTAHVLYHGLRAYLHAQFEKMENDEKFRKEAMEGMDEVVSKSLGLKPNAFRLAYI